MEEFNSKQGDTGGYVNRLRGFVKDLRSGSGNDSTQTDVKARLMQAVTSYADQQKKIDQSLSGYRENEKERPLSAARHTWHDDHGRREKVGEGRVGKRLTSRAELDAKWHSSGGVLFKGGHSQHIRKGGSLQRRAPLPSLTLFTEKLPVIVESGETDNLLIDNAFNEGNG
jgi:hypothetical protein